MAEEEIKQAAEETEELPEVEQQPEESEAEKLQKKIDETNDRLLRVTAEYDNFRKRSQKEKEAIYPDAVAYAVKTFLPVIDNVERAMQSECSDENYKKGVEMILTQFSESLKKLSVETIDPKGESFDPAFHHAVMHIEDESLPENTVAEVFQKGYRLGDRVIRVAMVKVAN